VTARAAPPADRVVCRRLDGVLGGLDVLRADFRRQCFAPHFHDDYTFGLITRGANRFRYRRERMVAPVGTLCLAMPGEVHTGDAIDGGWSYWTVHVPPAVLAELVERLDAGAPAAPDFARAVIDDPDAARRFAAFFAGCRDDPHALAHEVRIVEALVALVGRHAERTGIAGAARADAGIAARVRDLLADRATQTVTLADLEAWTGAGRYRLIRAFRAAYGLPPHAWQIQVRLARARTLIRSGVPIAVAAVEAGFADQAHLTRHFKRSYGHTPGMLIANATRLRAKSPGGPTRGQSPTGPRRGR
jgi:AraC-like DNA-binding protein